MADEKAVAVVEVQKNCSGCGKPMKFSKRYYRNGKYYCNKNCWKTGVEKENKEKAEKAAKVEGA